MTFEQAIRRSIKMYFKGMAPEELYRVQEKRPKYTKKYFDNIEEENFGNATTWDTITNV